MATTQYMGKERSKSVSYDPSKKSISSDDYQKNNNHPKLGHTPKLGTSTNNNNNNNNNNNFYNSDDPYNINSNSNNYNNSNNSYSYKSNGSSISSSSSNSSSHVSSYNSNSNRTNNHHYFNTRRHKKFTSVNSNGATTSNTTNSITNNDTYYNKSSNNKENNINSLNASGTTHTTATSNTNAPISNPSTPENATSPSKSRMKRLSLTVSISTQMYLEKMGKASASGVDSEDVKKMKNALSDLKKDCKNFTKNGRNTMFSLEKVNNNFGELVQEFGNGMLKPCEEGEALRILGEQISEFDQSMKEGSIGCLGQFLEPLASFYDEDLKKARELKRKQNLIRIRYEQSQTNLAEIKKKNDTYANKTLQAKSDLEECRKSYTSITKEFYEKMVENEKSFKLEIRKQIRDYVAMQVEFYREALDSWEEFAEEMDEIIPATSDEIASQEETIRKRLEADDGDGDSEENDDDLLADL